MTKLNRRNFFKVAAVLPSVITSKPSDFVTFEHGQPLYHGFQAMSGTSMELPRMIGRVEILAQLSRQTDKTRIIDELQRRIGTESKAENYQWRSDRG